MKAIFLLVLTVVVGSLALFWALLGLVPGDRTTALANIQTWLGQVQRNPLGALVGGVNGVNAVLPGGWVIAGGTAVVLVGVMLWLVFFIFKPIERFASLFGDRRRVAVWKWNRFPARRKTVRHLLAVVEQPLRWWRRWQARQRHAERTATAPASPPPTEANGGTPAQSHPNAQAEPDPQAHDETGAYGQATAKGQPTSDTIVPKTDADAAGLSPAPSAPDPASPAESPPAVQPVIRVAGPVMKELSGDTPGDRDDEVRPGDHQYVRLQLTGTVNPEDLTAVFQDRTRAEASLFHPIVGGAAKPTLLRERLPGPLRKLIGLWGDGHPMIEGLHVYWTDHDGAEHIDLLLRHTDGAHTLLTDVLRQAYQDVDWDWVSTSPLRILAADAVRNPFPDPTWDDPGDDAIPAREAVDDPNLPAPPVIEVDIESATEIRRLLDFQRAANLPYVARQVGSRGRWPRDNMLSYARVPRPNDDDTEAGEELQTGEFMAQVATRAADASVQTPVMVAVTTCYYCKYEKFYQKKEKTATKGETAEKRTQRTDVKRSGSSAGQLVEEQIQQRDERGEERGRYGTRRKELKLNTATGHLMGITLLDGGWKVRPSADVETALAGGQPPAASSDAPVCPPPGRMDVSVGHGASQLAAAVDTALSGGFTWIYTDPVEDLDSAYRGRQRLNHWLTLGGRLPVLGLPGLTTERALTNLQKRWIRMPRGWWGYKRNPTTCWPSHLTANEEVAVPFWPIDPDDSDGLTDAARELVRTTAGEASEQEEAESEGGLSVDSTRWPTNTPNANVSRSPSDSSDDDPSPAGGEYWDD